MYWDNTFWLVLPGLILAMWAQYRVKAAYKKYGAVQSRAHRTGAQVARAMLDKAGLQSVQIVPIAGNLTDNYDPSNNTLNLSQGVYGSTSIAAMGIAAHECGHAMQHQQGYALMGARAAIVPVVNIGSNLSWPIFLGGMIFQWEPLMLAGIMLFSLVVLFTLLTLPVEFNASARALSVLSEDEYLDAEELRGARRVLSAAALTYVASALSAVLQLVRLLALSNRRSRN